MSAKTAGLKRFGHRHRIYGLFAVGIILITLVKSSSDLYHILFGNVLAVRSSDMWITLVIGVIILTAVFLFYKELLITSFDPTMAAVYGLPNRLIHYF